MTRNGSTIFERRNELPSHGHFDPVPVDHARLFRRFDRSDFTGCINDQVEKQLRLRPKLLDDRCGWKLKQDCSRRINL
jgi:hypothetical protein